MSALENSVQTLATALDQLEGNLAKRLSSAVADSDAVEAAACQAKLAKDYIEAASEGVATSITEIKAMLDSDGQDKA